MKIDAYNCRIKENDPKPLDTKMILYYLSLRLTGDKVQKHKKTTDKRIYKNVDNLGNDRYNSRSRHMMTKQIGL